MILSLLYRMPPEQCRLIMIDPKMLELSVYDGIPHLLAPVVTDPRKAVVALKWAVREMEERYRKMSKLGVRGVEAFNDRVRKAKEKGEKLKRTVQTGFDRETGKPIYEDEMLELEPMPYIVVVVDEVADLMMISGKEIEGAVQRLAQMARAAGIHLIAATQRPSVDVITGTIKANFPTRISFQVTSKIDSRTILGEQGAEQLLGQGDMLYMMAGGRIRRIHGPFVTDHEVEDVVRFLKTQGTPEYLDAVTEEPDEDSDDPYALMGGGNGKSGDDLYDKALAIVARERKATTSYIQRRLQIGYNRAATLIERMEAGRRDLAAPTTRACAKSCCRSTSRAIRSLDCENRCRIGHCEMPNMLAASACAFRRRQCESMLRSGTVRPAVYRSGRVATALQSGLESQTVIGAVEALASAQSQRIPDPAIEYDSSSRFWLLQLASADFLPTSSARSPSRWQAPLSIVAKCAIVLRAHIGVTKSDQSRYTTHSACRRSQTGLLQDQHCGEGERITRSYAMASVEQPCRRHSQLDSFLAKFTPEMAKSAKGVLAAMRKRCPGAIELVYDNYNALAIGFATRRARARCVVLHRGLSRTGRACSSSRRCRSRTRRSCSKARARRRGTSF